jgi:hypothetical protein
VDQRLFVAELATGSTFTREGTDHLGVNGEQRHVQHLGHTTTDVRPTAVVSTVVVTVHARRAAAWSSLLTRAPRC